MDFIISYIFWTFSIIFAVLIVAIIFFAVWNLAFFKPCTSKASLKGKTVIITGATAGIGKEAAIDFARRGARLILACRNEKKAQIVSDDIKRSTKNTNVHVRVLDTSSLSSVRSFAQGILKTETRLDVLALNAGIGGRKNREITEDGLELLLATNHFGHFLLANLLAGLLEKTPSSRIVVTSSRAHYRASYPKVLYEGEKDYKTNEQYGKSKLYNVLMTKYLANYFHNKGVIVNCFCPGLVKTDIFATNQTVPLMIGGFFANLIGKTSEQGAQTLIYLAVSEEVENITGQFFVDNRETKPSKHACDVGLAKKVWEMSEDLVKLSPEECYFKKYK